MLQVSQCVPSATLPKVEANQYLWMLAKIHNLFCRLNPTCVTWFPFITKWKMELEKRLLLLWFSPHALITMWYNSVRKNINQRVSDMEQQIEDRLIPAVRDLGNQVIRYKPAKQLSQIAITKFWRTFNTLWTAVRKRGSKKISTLWILCYCTSGAIETRAHILFYCQSYHSLHTNLLHLYYHKFQFVLTLFSFSYLSSDEFS